MKFIRWLRDRWLRRAEQSAGRRDASDARESYPRFNAERDRQEANRVFKQRGSGLF